MRDLKVYTTYPHSCSYLEDQDFWRVNGIERSITLYAAPQTHIRDLKIDAGLTHDYRDGKLSAQVDLAGAAKATSVRATLLDGQSAVYGDGTISSNGPLSGSY